MANIQSLPTELWDMIFLLLCQTDRKSIRATCRILERHITSSIFRRITVSFLKTDRDNFLHISSAPRLQPFVREVVWYECDVNPPHPVEFPNYIRDCYPGLYRSVHPEWGYLDESDASSQIWKLTEAYRADLWWTSKPDSDTFKDNIEEDRALENLEKKRHDSLEIFGQALRRLPSLRTVVSQAMPGDRILPISDYPFTADVLRQKFPGRNISHGLFFLLDAMAAFDLNIQNLFWAHHTTGASLDSLSPLVSQGFKNLRLIDLCLTAYYVDDKHPDIMNLAHCLQSSVHLRDLTLCFERASPLESRIALRILPWFDHLIGGSYWPALENLRLAEFWIHPEEMLVFLQKHVNSLRRLSLEDCAIWKAKSVASSGLGAREGSWKSLVIGMRSIEGLGLKSLRIAQRKDAILVSEYQILEFIKGGNFNPLHDCPEKCLINTVETICDYGSWPAFAYNDALQHDDIHDLEYNDDDESDIGWTKPGETYYWHLCRNNGEIMCWSTTEPDDDAYATEQWLFKHRSGETALGNEPLEYFSDWDSEEGDTVEASPYGPSFDKFQSSEDASNGGHLENALAHRGKAQ